jgi:hypothetical protein
MFSKGLKRRLAVLLTGVMVFGMTVTAAAAPSTTKTGNGSADGDGAFEGHVNRKVVSVTLPTVSSDTFAFIMDSEGLMAETKANNAPVWNGYTFPTNNTNVYFKTGDKKFDSTSNTLTLSNNSSVSLNVTLKVDVTTPGSVKMVSSNEALTKEKDAALYLGLKIDDKTPVTVSSGGVTKTVSVNGTPNNYQVSVNEVNGKREYTFVQKTGTLTWQNLTFALTGAANKVDSAKGAVAPDITVTWNYEATEWEDDGTTPTGGGTTEPTEPEVTYTEKTGYLTWASATMWMAPAEDGAFVADTVTVEVGDGSTWTVVSDTSKYTYSGGWVSMDWDDFEAAGGSSALRITDGTDRYTITL